MISSVPSAGGRGGHLLRLHRRRIRWAMLQVRAFVSGLDERLEGVERHPVCADVAQVHFREGHDPPTVGHLAETDIVRDERAAQMNPIGRIRSQLIIPLGATRQITSWSG